MMKKMLLGFVVWGALSGAAFANANSQTGCGLGTIIISQPNSAVLYALQATTNHSTFTQTFGISSGTMNCRKAKFVLDERVQEFVAANMDALHKEIAMARGDTLDTLAELLEVEDKQAFRELLQENYLAIYQNVDVDMASTLDSIQAL